MQPPGSLGLGRAIAYATTGANEGMENAEAIAFFTRESVLASIDVVERDLRDALPVSACDWCQDLFIEPDQPQSGEKRNSDNS